MNEKFFDLKKEKQDRMINGALKVFARNGYGHASTDDIVKEAGISKGLLFHYFISKIGLYSFIYDYGVKYLLLELSTGVDTEEKDYFEIWEQICSCEQLIMRNYPYLIWFLMESKRENVSEALLETEDARRQLFGKYEELLQKADQSKFREGVDLDRLNKMVNLTVRGLMMEHFIDGDFQPDQFHTEAVNYLKLMKTLCIRED